MVGGALQRPLLLYWHAMGNIHVESKQQNGANVTQALPFVFVTQSANVYSSSDKERRKGTRLTGLEGKQF